MIKLNIKKHAAVGVVVVSSISKSRLPQAMLLMSVTTVQRISQIWTGLQSHFFEYLTLQNMLLAAKVAKIRLSKIQYQFMILKSSKAEHFGPSILRGKFI